MGRKEERIMQALEKNPIIKCNEVQRRFCPDLFQMFADTTDPRHQSYINYPNKLMLGTLYYKGIAGITSMQEMSYQFNKPEVVDNITSFLGVDSCEFLPHYVTENDFLEKLPSQELQKVIQDMVYQMIRRKSFNDARFMKKWIVIIDGTQLYSGSRKLNEKCLKRHYNKGTDKEKVNYHQDVLEAKIYFGEKLLCSIASEFIENNGEDSERQKHMKAEELKQDCETKAFGRLAEKIKKAFARLPILLLMDSLYASEPVMKICEEKGWDYMIRYKVGSIPSIGEEYEKIPEKEKTGHCEYINEIGYNGHQVNVLKYDEEKVEKGEVKRTEFQWLMNIRITSRNAEKLTMVGRRRWKIENEGFNRQKNWQGDITHACSFDEQAQKNHYLMHQISDFIKQLYEYYYLKKNEIKKKQKNISSELLASFGRQLTKEDISSKLEADNVATN